MKGRAAANLGRPLRLIVKIGRETYVVKFDRSAKAKGVDGELWISQLSRIKERRLERPVCPVQLIYTHSDGGEEYEHNFDSKARCRIHPGTGALVFSGGVRVKQFIEG